uniref:(northern house mosquito) hypothetical protein n=1 Tax=Culex pipiens TaxID=7175 RepID=A0A8D8EYI9_CULPI
MLMILGGSGCFLVLSNSPCHYRGHSRAQDVGNIMASVLSTQTRLFRDQGGNFSAKVAVAFDWHQDHGQRRSLSWRSAAIGELFLAFSNGGLDHAANFHKMNHFRPKVLIPDIFVFERNGWTASSDFSRISVIKTNSLSNGPLLGLLLFFQT